MSNYKPIIFSTPMIQAILDNRKRMTRRVIKPQPFAVDGDNVYDGMGLLIPPRFFPGDILWARETWCNTYPFASGKCPDGPYYRATDEGECGAAITGQCWRSAIHMPKAACRLFLRVTAVRPERVQDIREEDAEAEGIPVMVDGHIWHMPDGTTTREPRTAFSALWDSIYKKRGFGWDMNPWVWVYEFERTERPEGWPQNRDRRNSHE